jgi:hypothetical protein
MKYQFGDYAAAKKRLSAQKCRTHCPAFARGVRFRTGKFSKNAFAARIQHL